MKDSLLNEQAWDKKVEEGNKYTYSATKEDLENAKKGIFNLDLGAENIPSSWIPKDISTKRVLCLASGGGLQSAIFAAAGADVTVVDISASQLESDKAIAEAEGLTIKTVKSDMRDLSMFDDNSFDLVFCPVSITYIDSTVTLFKEISRVLKKGATLLFAAPNPHIYLYDGVLYDEGTYLVKNKLPFNSFDELNEEETEQFIKDKRAVEYSHTMDAIIGEMLRNGFMITDFFESNDDDDICKYFSKYFNFQAVKR